jgi:hypothetical protein
MTVPLNSELSAAFIVAPHDQPAIEIRINFGIFAGREVTSVEIDRLADLLLDEVEGVTIVAEERHEIGHGKPALLHEVSRVEGSVHQVRIELGPERVPRAGAERRELERVLVERADYWLRLCVADRHGDLSDP